MPRALPVLSAALFLAGIGAGRYWGGSRSADSRAAAPGPHGASASRPSADAPSRPGVSAGEGQVLAMKLEAATLEEVVALWSVLPAEDATSPSEEGYTGPWKRLLLLERWAELDAPGALAAAREHGGEGLPRMISAVFRSWAAGDAGAAMEAVQAEAGESQIRAAIGWLSAWTDEPGQLARRAAELKWMDVSTLTEQDFRAAVPTGLLRKIHAADRDGLLALSGWLPPEWYDGVLRELDWHAAWAKGGEEARAAVDSLVTTNDDIRRMAPDLAPLFYSRPEEAMDLLDRVLAKYVPDVLPDSTDPIYFYHEWKTDSLIAGIVNNMGLRDPERVSKRLHQAVDWDQAGGAGAALLNGLAKNDPAATLRLAAELYMWDYPTGRGASFPHPLDAAGALAAVREGPSSSLRERWLDQALRELSPAEAAAWVETLPEGDLRTSARTTLENRDRPESERILARAVARTLGDDVDDSVRDAARDAAAGAEPPGLTARVAAWPESSARDSALKTLVPEWFLREPAEALAWTATLPDEALRASIGAGVAAAWADRDFTAAAAWMDSLPPGPEREAVMDEFLSGLAEVNPVSAAEWSASLTDSPKRMANLRHVLTVWRGQDAEAAAIFLRESPDLTEAERASLTEHLSTP